MATAGTPAPAKAPEPEQAHVQAQPKWRRFVVPALIVLLAVVIFVTITRNWNGWEGGRVQQVTDDAYVRGDLTPLSTKVAGIVRDVKVTDYQQVRKGQLIVELDDDDFRHSWIRPLPQLRLRKLQSRTITGSASFRTPRLSAHSPESIRQRRRSSLLKPA